MIRRQNGCNPIKRVMLDRHHFHSLKSNGQRVQIVMRSAELAICRNARHHLSFFRCLWPNKLTTTDVRDPQNRCIKLDRLRIVNARLLCGRDGPIIRLAERLARLTPSPRPRTIGCSRGSSFFVITVTQVFGGQQSVVPASAFSADRWAGLWHVLQHDATAAPMLFNPWFTGFQT